MSLKRTIARGIARQQQRNQQIIVKRTMRAVERLTKDETLAQPTILEQLKAGPIVYYDTIPDANRVELDRLARDGKIRVERDTDRVGWSKTGIIYRVTRV